MCVVFEFLFRWFKKKEESKELKRIETRRLIRPEEHETHTLDRETGGIVVDDVSTLKEGKIEQSTSESGIIHINFNNKQTKRLARPMDPITRRISRKELGKRRDEFYGKDGKLIEE